MRALAIAALLATSTPAAAERELCAPGARFRGKAIDLDFQRAELGDVFRLLADAGGMNLVVADGVKGKVTLKLRRVAWDRAMCAIAGVHKLSITVDDTILLVRQRDGGAIVGP